VSAVELVPLLIIALGLCVVGWIYGDAKRHAEVGNPVVGRVGSLVVDTPAAWAAGCLLLSIFFIPLYVTSRE
jgi:uncharacterized membrane protein YhdT